MRLPDKPLRYWAKAIFYLLDRNSQGITHGVSVASFRYDRFYQYDQLTPRYEFNLFKNIIKHHRVMEGDYSSIGE